MKKICVGLVLGVCKKEEMAADMMYVTSSLTRCMCPLRMREFVNSDCSKHVSFLNNLRLR